MVPRSPGTAHGTSVLPGEGSGVGRDPSGSTLYPRVVPSRSLARRMRYPVAPAVRAADAAWSPIATAASGATTSDAASTTRSLERCARAFTLRLCRRLSTPRFDEAAAAPVLERPRHDQVDRDDVRADPVVRVAADVP